MVFYKRLEWAHQFCPSLAQPVCAHSLAWLLCWRWKTRQTRGQFVWITAELSTHNMYVFVCCAWWLHLTVPTLLPSSIHTEYGELRYMIVLAPCLFWCVKPYATFLFQFITWTEWLVPKSDAGERRKKKRTAPLGKSSDKNQGRSSSLQHTPKVIQSHL